jgi:predicted Zn-dependent peptidase
MGQRYRAERVLVAAAGKVDHDALSVQCERLFGGIARNGKVDTIKPPTVHSLVLNHEKQLEQAHICLGGPGISQTNEARYAGYVLNTALGGGMSSRLFQEVREKRGKVYSIYSFLSSHIDCGYFGVYAGTNPEWVDEVLEITLAELKKVAHDGLTKPELERAKSQLKGNLLLGLESTDARMNRLARNEIYFRRDIPVEELARDIEAVTNDQVMQLAGTFFDRNQMALVVLGDLKGRALPADIFSAL